MAAAVPFDIDGDAAHIETPGDVPEDNQVQMTRPSWHYAVLTLVLLSAAAVITYEAYRYTKLQDTNFVSDLEPESKCEFDFKRAQELANLASISYCQSSTVEAWVCQTCDTRMKTPVLACPREQFDIEIGEEQKDEWWYKWSPRIYERHVYVGIYDGKPVITFQGELAGWKSIQNLSTSFWEGDEASGADWGWWWSMKWLTESCHGCKVSEEIVAEWLFVRRCVADSLNKLGFYPGTSISLAGHGKGGAAAMVAALDLRQRGWNVTELYTFGSPRVGDARFANYVRKSFMGTFWRITNARDPLPNLPQRQKGFVHPGPEVLFANEQDEKPVKICHKVEDDTCSMQFRNRASNEHYEEKHWTYLGKRMGNKAAANCGDEDLAWYAGTENPVESSWSISSNRSKQETSN